MVENRFHVENFRFTILKDCEVPIRAQLVVYRFEGPYMVGVLMQEFLFERREPFFKTLEERDAWLYMDYRIKPYPGPEEEIDGFIKIDEREITSGKYEGSDSERIYLPILPEYDFIVTPTDELVLERGAYLVTIKFLADDESIDLMNRYPWVFPRIGIFTEPGLLREGDQLDFDSSDTNAGIVVHGYGH